MHRKNIVIIAVVLLLPQTGWAIAADLYEGESRFQERLCERVVRRFAENDRVWKRVNKRIEKRFSFRCTRLQDQIRITDVIPTSSTTLEIVLDTDISTLYQFALDDFTVKGGPTDFGIKRIDLLFSDEENVTDVLEITLKEHTEPGYEIELRTKHINIVDRYIAEGNHRIGAYSPICLSCGGSLLEVRLSHLSPQATTVSPGAQATPVLAFDLTASCDDSMTIHEFTVLHEGLGNPADVAGLYAMQDDIIISNADTVDPNYSTFNFRLNTPLNIDVCATATIVIMMNLTPQAQAGAKHVFLLELPSDVLSDALDTTGNFPIRGNTVNVKIEQ